MADNAHDHALRTRIAELEGELAWWRSGAGPTDVALYAELFRALGEATVTVQEISRASIRSPALNVALVAALGSEWNGRKLGKRLAKLQDERLAGVRIHPIGDSGRDGTLWSITRRIASLGTLKLAEVVA